jgi:hypothetical protein
MYAGLIRGEFILAIEQIQSEVAGIFFWRRLQEITDDVEVNLFRTRLSGEIFGPGGDKRFFAVFCVTVGVP